MKVLIIRHGLTKSNVRDYEAGFRFPNNEEKQSEYKQKVREQQGARELSEDSVLTDVGEQEAVRLGQYWGPLLETTAKRNKLEVLISPMYRTLQTIHPLMTYLHEKTNLTANVYGEFFECGGLMSANDRAFMDDIEIRVANENNENDPKKKAQLRQERIQLYRSHNFSQVGLTMNEMNAMYPWLGKDFTGMKIDDPNTPWHLSHSDWSDKYMAERVERVANMLREKAKHVALNHIVVLVGHGDMNKRVLFNLLGIDTNKVSTNLQNTSCSLLTLNPKENMTNLNFFNRTPHLVNNIEGDSRNLTSYATDHGLYMPGGKEMRKQMFEYFPHSFEGKSRL